MKTTRLLIILVLLSVLLLAGCAPRARVGALRTESQSVDLGDAGSVRVEIGFGAGELRVAGGAAKLLEADFAYNVARLKPEVAYSDGRLVISQPEAKGFPALQNLADFQNEWGLQLYDQVPMDLSVNVGAGTSELKLAGLSLTGLDITQGAGISTIDLSGDWARDLDITIDTGATDLTVRLPGNVGARVEVESGPHTIDATGLTKDGAIYTNAAYGVSDVTLQVNVKSGIGRITLEAEEAQSTVTE